MGMVRVDLDQRQAGHSQLERARDLRQTLSDQVPYANTLYRLADLDRRGGHYWKAVSSLEESLEIYREADEREAQALIHMSLGLCYRRLSQLATSLHHYEAALALLREVGWHRYELSALKNLGVAYQALGGDVERAREYFLAGLAKVEELKEMGLERSLGTVDAGLLSDIGWGLKQQGEFEAAKDTFERAAEIAGRAGASREASILDNLARTNIKLGDLDRAEYLTRRALELTEDPGQQAGRYITAGMIELNRFLRLRPKDLAGAHRANTRTRKALDQALKIARNQNERRL